MTPDEKIEHFASCICGKPFNITSKQCHSSLGRANPLCSDYETCRIAEKSEEQLDYVLASIQNCVFLKACPGSGKTEVVGLKAAFEMTQWEKRPGGIAVLTFTNNAAKVIEKRVGQFAGVGKIEYPHFIGTIDSWLHGYIAHPFAHDVTGYGGKDGDHSIRVIDSTSQAEFLNAFRTKYRIGNTGNPAANHYYYDIETEKYIFASGTQNVDRMRNSQNLEDWQVTDLKETKRRFEKAGFATYQDIERICFGLLTKPEFARILSRRFPFIIIDECQDLSWQQIQILDKLRVQGTTLHFVGDLNQAIYEFKKVVPEKVEKYTQEKKFNTLSLSENYRSCRPIADLCAKLVGDTGNISSNHISKQKYPCVCMIFKKNEIMKLPDWFSGYLNQLGIDKQHSAIVARSWTSVSRMRPAGNRKIRNYQEQLAMAVYLWKTGCRQATEDALKFFGRFVTEKFFPKQSTNARESYRPESVGSALTWRLFLATILSKCCQDTRLGDLQQLWPDWARATRDKMHEHLSKSANMFGTTLSGRVFSPLVARNKNGKSLPVFSTPHGKSNEKVLSTLPSNSFSQESLRITTIHNVKGETLEALMLVSSIDTRGTIDGHWTMWLDKSTSEATRLAYVASSRPRQLLIWAIPEPCDIELDKLKQIGFQVLTASEITL